MAKAILSAHDRAKSDLQSVVSDLYMLHPLFSTVECVIDQMNNTVEGSRPCMDELIEYASATQYIGRQLLSEAITKLNETHERGGL